MKILTFAGSLRADSFNKKYAREALRIATELGHAGEFLDLRELALPVYDEDVKEKGFPEGVNRLAAAITAADAIIISAPEYNGGISGALKNTIDWTSRLRPDPFKDKHLLLIGASTGALGAVRGLWHTRVPFEAMGVHVYPTMNGLAQAHTHFDAEGKLIAEKEKPLRELIEKFLAHVGK